MGRPFSQELKKIEDTYNWALHVLLEPILKDVKNKPLWIVGSGGSLSACELLSLLQFNFGGIGLPITPLELQYRRNAINQESIAIFISASGRNSDILFAFDTFVSQDPDKIIGLCFKKDSLLSKKSELFSVSKTIDFEIPTGKDGFLATNSLIGYFTIIPRLYGIQQSLINLTPTTEFLNSAEIFADKLYEDFTITVLYGGWGKPVAIDLESKFSEAGLGNILLADYRNFGHGRHNWFDKKKKQSAIIALISPEEKELAHKTLQLLPGEIPVLILDTEESMANASLQLLVKSFYTVETFGKKCGIDPGRPGVPDYGSKLYKLKYSKFYQKSLQDGISNKAQLAISKKLNNIHSIEIEQLLLWNNYYTKYKARMEKTAFKGLILDYDGTICSSDERLSGPRKEIKERINYFIRQGVLIGIVTGRGKSAKKDLQEFIPKEYWKNVIMGYYNGSQIGTLDNDKLPITTNINRIDSLQEINKLLSSEQLFDGQINTELRPGQLTITINNPQNSETVKKVVVDIVRNNYPFEVQVLESSHSIDIISIKTSKTEIIRYCRDLLNDSIYNLNFLCIGDRGRWSGNDYQLLSEEFSLSVDQVSADPYSCWNFASVGNRCVEATLEYFNAMNVSGSYFTIKI
jgi:hydroxymethylpyrimidine pyrophosphatase-like HAD family hydrolase